MQCPTCGSNTPGTLGRCSNCEAPIDVYSLGPQPPLGAPVADAPPAGPSWTPSAPPAPPGQGPAGPPGGGYGGLPDTGIDISGVASGPPGGTNSTIRDIPGAPAGGMDAPGGADHGRRAPAGPPPRSRAWT
ncbi:hypothetical protein [Actinomadura sp. CNU-125]|uniref:hypothetical protein n=1 Tax=Actinomadura sp. CNU-125 TaxID=1904961 RepID=UPI001177A44F|nr:hypothetical protein [Actinomadura sp. CNU-125]